MLLVDSIRRLSALVCYAGALGLAACAVPDGTVAPAAISSMPRRDLLPNGGVVISQLYGGGGNAGATLKNDFIELYNNSTCAVDLTGWSVQYAFATGTSWQATNLSGTIAAGGYYLVQQSLGTGGTQDLPAPINATGSIAMSATAGKVALVNATTALTTAASTGASIVDFVGFGTTAGTYEGTGPTPAPGNTVAVVRKDGGRTDTNDNQNDFVAETGVLVPRNSATTPLTPTGTCGSGGGTTAGPITQVNVAPAPTASVSLGNTITFIATARDANNVVANTTFAWSSSDQVVATIGADGKATALKIGTTNITATANNIVSAVTVLTVTTAQNSVSISSYSGFATGLPIGFQTQLFVNSGSKDGIGATVDASNVTWTSADPLTLAVDARTGGITALKAGTTRITATATSDGSPGSALVTTATPNSASSARIGHNLELGTPTDADPSDDYLIARKQYTLSYNPLRGGPNWVSWNLDASHKGSSPRCNCFTADPAVSAFGFIAFSTNDWINGGVFSRGHMSPSADWANVEGDNAGTYYLSNMLPQNQTLNGGVWGALENDLRARATGTAEIYIIAGPVYTKNRIAPGVDGLGFLASTTQPKRIAIPDSIWKIAILVPDVRDGTTVTLGDVDVIATMFPNSGTGTSSSASNAWLPWKTTIAAIQRSTGYNFLSLLPEAAQCKIETRCLPVPALLSASHSNTTTVGIPLTLQTSATDAGGAGVGPWSYLLEWGDGTSFATTLGALPRGTRPLARSKVYSSPGSYTVRLTITDKFGGAGVRAYPVVVNAPVP